MAKPPRCKLCKHEHWVYDPHIFDAEKQPLTPVGEAEVSLTETEAETLAQLEAVIAPRVSAWMIVGEALTQIRDKRLYRAAHETFEDYCRERWHISRQHAARLVIAANVAGIIRQENVTNLVTNPLPPLPNEATARELAPLRDDPPALKQAWAETVERAGPAPTAQDVRETLRPPERSQPGIGSLAPSVPLDVSLSREIAVTREELIEVLRNLLGLWTFDENPPDVVLDGRRLIDRLDA